VAGNQASNQGSWLATKLVRHTTSAVHIQNLEDVNTRSEQKRNHSSMGILFANQIKPNQAKRNESNRNRTRPWAIYEGTEEHEAPIVVTSFGRARRIITLQPLFRNCMSLGICAPLLQSGETRSECLLCATIAYYYYYSY
jgi:hypothetical protein